MQDYAREIVNGNVCPKQEKPNNSQVVRRAGKLMKMIGSASEHNFQEYKVPSDSTKLQHMIEKMQLPDGSVHTVGTAELHQELSECFAEFAALTPEDAKRIAFYVLLTWVSDRLDFCPALLLLVSDPADGLPLLHVMKACCRNALGVRSSTLADLPDELEPSLIMDLSWLNRARVRKIVSANSRNFREPIGERLLNTALPKVILCRDSVNDIPVLQVSLQPACVKIPNAQVLRRLAERLQPRLLAYRLSFEEVEFGEPELTFLGNSVALVANSLLFTVQGVEQLQAQLKELLQAEAQASSAEILVTPESLVLESIIGAIHANKVQSLTCGDIAVRANILAEARGETSTLTAKAVGSHLRLLSLPTRRIAGRGRGISLDTKTRERAHQAAYARNLPAVETPEAGCRNCQQNE